MRRAVQIFAMVTAMAVGGGLTRCHKTPPPPPPASVDAGAGEDAATPPPPPNRCQLDLTPLMAGLGKTAHARRIEEVKDLIPGDATLGRIGDFAMENDKIRLVIQAPDRHIQPNPYGGAIIDAALVGPDGHDSFGKLAVFYAFGRTQLTTDVSVLDSGEAGGAAVVVADGTDTVNDFINLNGMIGSFVPGKGLTLNPDDPQPLHLSTYYVLNPGESRVRVATAFCNESQGALALPVGDLIDSGGTVEFFQPASCTGGMGYGGSFTCLISEMSWYGFLGDGVAYGYAPYKPGSSTRPAEHNLSLAVAGVVTTLSDATLNHDRIAALLDWTDPNVKDHDGLLAIPPAGKNVMVRDFLVGRDLGEVASLIATYRNDELHLPMGDLGGTVTVGGKPVAGARVALEQDVPQTSGGTARVVQTVFVTDAAGSWSGHLPAGAYYLSAWALGSAPSASVDVAIQANGKVAKDFDLVAPRLLTVEVRDLDGKPMPGKVSLLCPSFPCDVPNRSLVRYLDTVRDVIPDNVAALDFVGPTGTRTFAVPPGKYRLVVSRGPAWSIFPNTFKPDPVDASTGYEVDLTAADVKVTATLAHVLDTRGWITGDFHVHAVNSPDAYVANTDRLLSFMAEGVDVLVATDHDYVTDFAPLNKQLGGEKFLATVPGEEVTTFDYGHANIFPLIVDENDLTHGAVDWGGGAGPSLSTPDYLALARKRGAKTMTVQINHARGSQGVFSASLIDTDTGWTHSDGKVNRIAPQPGATPTDTRLLAFDFNAMEILNGNLDQYGGLRGRYLMNDWFSFLSRGAVVAATGVSDTHQRFASAAGYWRTWVHSGASGPADFDPLAFSDAVNHLKVVPTNGPFVELSARALDGAGQPVADFTEIGGTLPPAVNGFELTVNVQGPSWMRFDHLELLTHIDGGDVPCNVSADPKLNPRSRIACNGNPNPNWPADGIAASAPIHDADLLFETTATKDGVTYQRVRALKKFTLPRPAHDTWYVVAVYGAGSMFPLVYSNVGSDGKIVDVMPFAMTNPIFVDADGNGYDKFPSGKLGGGGPGGGYQPRPKLLHPHTRITLDEAQRLYDAVVKETP